MMISMKTVDLSCVSCGRELGRQTVSCPKRPSRTCSYQQIVNKSHIAQGVFAGFFAVFILGLGIQEESILATIIGIFILLAGIVWATYRVTVLYSNEFKVKLIYRSLFFFELHAEIVKSAEPIEFKINHPESLTFPASVVELFSLQVMTQIRDNLRNQKKRHLVLGVLGGPAMRILVRDPLYKLSSEQKEMIQSVALFKIALIDLISRDCIKVRRHSTYAAYLRKGYRRVDDSFSLLATNQHFKDLDGSLEHKIMNGLRIWANQEEFRDSSDGVTIVDLVRTVYGMDVDFAHKWLIDLVASDAVAKNLARYEGVLKKKLVPNDDPILQQQTLVSELVFRFEREHPSLSVAFDREIERGIRSREAPAD